MCFTNEQHPPEPPRTSEVGDHGPLLLTAADGSHFSAYRAVSVIPRGASLVLLPDIRGMRAFYTDLALCYAQTGIDTVAIDPSGRTAGLGARGDGFDFRPHAAALTAADVLADARVAVGRLRAAVEDVVADLTAPLLILAAGDDAATSPQENEAFVDSLDEADKVQDFVAYEGAPHSFFDRGFAQWRAECADAWIRMLGFIDRNR